MGDKLNLESVDETSNPDIDSILQRHLGPDFCYRKREASGSTSHILKKMKKGRWKDHITVEDEEVRGFADDEIATFLILKDSNYRIDMRTTGGTLLLWFIVGFPVDWYISSALGIFDAYSIPSLLVFGAVFVPFIILCCLWSNSAEKSADHRLYSSLPNFITVLQKLKDLEEVEYKKKDYDERIQRLSDQFQTRPIE
ncbi:MAG: hypothetical protein ACFFCP_11670 [Promethearchaeota archaeon]